LVVTYGWLPV